MSILLVIHRYVSSPCLQAFHKHTREEAQSSRLKKNKKINLASDLHERLWVKRTTVWVQQDTLISTESVSACE